MVTSMQLELEENNDAFFLALQESFCEKDNETQLHTQRMKNMVFDIGRTMNINRLVIDRLALLAGVHDIGKLLLPKSILLKSGSLTNKEWYIMRKHPELGYRIAQTSPLLKPVARGILHHHERWDGGGYPHGLKGNAIPFLSRMIAIVDAYDAMIHDRPYRKALEKEDALEEIKKYSSRQFDPELVDIFINLVKNKK